MERVAINAIFCVKNGFFIETLLKMAFRFKSFETWCGVNMILTEENVYLVRKDLLNEINDISNATKSQKIVNDLILADEDFNYIITKERLTQQMEMECQLLLMTLKLFILQEDKFMKFKDTDNNEIILYTKNGQIFQPPCISTYKVTIPLSSKFCYDGIPVQLNTISNESTTGFLINDGIIREHSKIVDCASISKLQILPDKTNAISRVGNEYKVVSISSLHIKKLNIFRLKSMPDIKHAEIIKEGADILNQVRNLIQVEESEGRVYVDKSSYENSISGLNDSSALLVTARNWIISFGIFTKLIIIFALSFSILSLILICKFKGYCNCCNKIYINITKFFRTKKNKQNREYNIVEGGSTTIEQPMTRPSSPPLYPPIVPVLICET
jgi:hypothetical protein